MGILIPMPRSLPGRAGPRTPEGSGVGGAEIVFFTGVRYERHEDKPAIGEKDAGPLHANNAHGGKTDAGKTDAGRKDITPSRSRPRRRRA